MKKLFVCALALVFLATPAMATDWDFYGNFQFDTATTTVSKEANAVNTNYDDTDSLWGDNGISRFGGKVTKGDIFGNVEFNYAGATAGIRHLYGEWNFGAGKLLIGHTWDLTFQGGSLQNMQGGISSTFGMSRVRTQQLRLTFGGLQIAASTPSSGNTGGGADKDITLPQLAVRYTFATDMFSVQPLLAWQSVDYSTGVLDNTTDVTSTLWGVLGKVNFGPAYVNARVWGGTNTGDLGINSWINDSAAWNAATLKFDDTTALCYGGVIGFKLSDTITLEGGYAAISTEVTQGAVKTERDGNEYYLLASIQLAPGVTLQPEYFKQSNGDTKVTGVTPDVDNGEQTWMGLNWVINF